jgi:hypothetical protein
MQASTWVTIVTAILAFLTQLTGAQLDALWPGHGVQLGLYIGIAVLGLGQIINAISKQTKGAVQTGIQAGPLATNLPIVDPAGSVIAQNVTTTSTVPIVAPQKG